MNKSILVRRVAILLALVIGVMQMQIGGAEVATSYDFALSNFLRQADVTGGGSLSTEGIANVSGTLAATATVSSDSAVFFGSQEAFRASQGPNGRAVGANRAKVDSYLYKRFGTGTGTFTATITVDVSGITSPTVVTTTPSETSTFDSFCEPSEVGVTGFCTGTRPVVAGSDAAAYVALYATAYFVNDTALCANGQTPPEAPAGCTYRSSTYLSNSNYSGTPEAQAILIHPGTNTLVITGIPAGIGAIQIDTHLISEAYAIGTGAAAQAGCHLKVTSIELA